LNATNRTLVWECCGSAHAGGYLGTVIGIVPTMLVGGTIALGASVVMDGGARFGAALAVEVLATAERE
jgi:hypothetical protein